MSAETEIMRHVFVFNKKDNGGEAFFVTTTLHSDGGSIYLNQDWTLQSYCNCATFNLLGAAASPQQLRQLADQLEQAIAKAKENL